MISLNPLYNEINAAELSVLGRSPTGQARPVSDNEKKKNVGKKGPGSKSVFPRPKRRNRIELLFPGVSDRLDWILQ